MKLHQTLVAAIVGASLAVGSLSVTAGQLQIGGLHLFDDNLSSEGAFSPNQNGFKPQQNTQKSVQIGAVAISTATTKLYKTEPILDMSASGGCGAFCHVKVKSLPSLTTLVMRAPLINNTSSASVSGNVGQNGHAPYNYNNNNIGTTTHDH